MSTCKYPPLSYRFDVNDMVLFHNIISNLIPVTLPEYLSLFDGNNPLRVTHLDELCYVSNIITRHMGISNLNKSFFFCIHTLWNSLPYDIRNLKNPKEFNTNLEFLRNISGI